MSVETELTRKEKVKRICFSVSTLLTAKAFLEKHSEVLSREYSIYLIGNFSYEDENVLANFPCTAYKSFPIERKINLLKDLQATYLLSRYFKKMKFDAVHSVTPKAGLLSMLAAYMAGIKERIHIFTGQVWYTKKGIAKKLLQYIDKFIVFLSTRIIIDSEGQRKFLKSHGIISDNTSVVFGKGSISGVNTDRFCPDQNRRASFRKGRQIDDDVVVYLFLGRINRDKGCLDLIKAFGKLYQANKNCLLLLVGYDEENIIPGISVQLDEESYKFLGPTSEAEKFYQCADVFCLPSYREGFGTSVIEASACELPVICSNIYGLTDTIIDGETGFRHEVGSVDSLLKKMEILLNDSNLRLRLGKQGRSYVLQNFSATAISDHWLNFYKSILN